MGIKYSKISSTWLTRDWTGAELSNILDYQMVLYWYKFLQVIFCYCSCTGAVQLVRGVFYLDISFICWLRSSGSSSVFSGVLIAEEGEGVGDKGSECNRFSTFPTLYLTALVSSPLHLQQLLSCTLLWIQSQVHLWHGMVHHGSCCNFEQLQLFLEGPLRLHLKHQQ